MKRTNRDKNEWLLGVLIALGCVYEAGAETIAEDIIKLVGPVGLLRVAKKEQDLYLPNLRKTIRFLKGREEVNHA
jgi:hypothetical protein